MKKLWLAAVVLLLPLTGCTVQITQGVAKRLKVSEMNRTFGFTPVNLGARSKCLDQASVSIVNQESRTDDFYALQNPPYQGVINPKEMMDAVASYLEESYKLSEVRVMPESTKVLQLKMVDLVAAPGAWTFGSSFKTELTIPETGFQKIYEGSDNAANGHTAAAAAIAMAARKIVDDPEIQDYLLCSNTAPAPAAATQPAPAAATQPAPVAATQPASGEPLPVQLQEPGEPGEPEEQGAITQEEYRLEQEEFVVEY